MSHWFALPAWFISVILCAAFWWWEGRPVAIPDAPSNVIPCLSFAPYRGTQSAMDAKLVIPVEQIEEDLRLLSRFTRCVRTYGVGQGLDRVPEIAERYGLKVMLGAWISPNASDNARELALAIDVANRFPDTVSALVVGNEVLLRGDLPEHELVAQLRSAREAVSVPITYADVTDYWFRHRAVGDSVDFVTIHILPYWDDDPVGVGETMLRARALWEEAREVFPEKRLFVGEAGWPSAGRMRGAALPSRVNQARFVRELLTLARLETIDLNLIEAFDQPWKRINEGTVGGYWGLFSEPREPKISLTGPVSDDPSWRAHLAWSGAIALLPMVLVLILGKHVRPAFWFGLGLASHAAACALVVALLNVLQRSLAVADWAVGLSRWGLAVAVFFLIALAFIRRTGTDEDLPRVPPARDIVEILRSRAFRSFRGLEPALGLVRALTLFGAAVVTLGLVFDARYRDFPVAVYAVPAVAFALLALRRRAGRVAHLREEILLAGVAAAGAVVVVLLEGIANHQALAWMAVNFVLVGTVALEASRRRGH
jgi:exo-beta-1,3-glucanase (GH17 family)